MTGREVTFTAEGYAELRARVVLLWEMADHVGNVSLRDAASDVYELLVQAETDDGPIPIADGQLSLLDWLHDGGAA